MTTFNNQTTISLHGRQITLSTNGQYYYSSVPWVVYSAKIGKKYTGSDDPGWKLKIERGVSATNAYTSEFSYVAKAVSAKTLDIARSGQTFVKKWSEVYGYSRGDPTWNESLVTSLTNTTMGKLYGILQDIATPVNGLEFLAEFRDSVQMVKSPLKSLGDYLNRHLAKQVKAYNVHQAKLRSINAKFGRRYTEQRRLRDIRREASRFTKLAAQLRLEYKFGWEPLVTSIGDAAKAATEVFPDEGVITTYRKSTTQRTSTSSTILQSAGGEKWYEYVTEEYEYKVTLVMRYQHSGKYAAMSELEQLYERSGFLKSQLIPLAWELAPLSVFTDYFANVGQVLSAACTETRQVVSVDRYVRRRMIRRTVLSFQPSIYGSKDPTYERQGLVVQAFGKYTREKWAMTIPSLTFTTPIDHTGQLLNLASFVRLAFFK